MAERGSKLNRTLVQLGAAAAVLVLLTLSAFADHEKAGAAGTDGRAVRAAAAEHAVNPVPLAAAITVDLCAKTGSLTMPDSTVVTIWGLALGTCSTAGPATVPGPLIDVPVGAAVTVNLENSLTQNVGLQFPGQSLVPDTTGAAPAGMTSYTFTADRPGIFLYESGTNSSVQTAMGLYGAMIVRPLLAGAAYEDAGTQFDQEAVLVLGEIDPLLNNSVDPNTFNFLNYDPQYWLINGKAYPDTDPIVADVGERVLLRYVNAGLMNHTVSTLGFHTEVIGQEGNQLNYSYEAVALTVASGQTFDVLATVPAADPGSQFPIYSGQLRLTNGNDFPGGMLTFLTVGGILSLSGNCSSPATMADALTIAQYVVGLRPAIRCAGNADVNRDGQVTIVDALIVARYVLGLN